VTVRFVAEMALRFVAGFAAGAVILTGVHYGWAGVRAVARRVRRVRRGWRR